MVPLSSLTLLLLQLLTSTAAACSYLDASMRFQFHIDRPSCLKHGTCPLRIHKQLETTNVVQHRVAVCMAAQSGGVLKHIKHANPLLLIDGNNVRGAVKFATSQRELLAAVVAFADAHQLQSILLLDHGDEQQVWRTSEHSAVLFSGQQQSADDVIVRDAWWVRNTAKRNVVVVTSDGGLTLRVRRCRAAGSAQVVTSASMAAFFLGNLSALASDFRAEGTDERASEALSIAADLKSGDLIFTLPGSSSIRVLDEYVAWIADAPKSHSYTDPMPMSPSTKRSLRRKRHKTAPPKQPL
eukprot:5253036-Pleurochrysis_carterae.AAC.3